MSLNPYIRAAGEHERLGWLGQSEVEVLLDSAASGGPLAILSCDAQSGDASPIHVHAHEDETFVVLEGRVTVWVGDDRQDLGPGGVAFLPKEIPHAYRVAEDGTRFLNICTPAGFEEFFREAGNNLADPRPAGWSIDPAELAKIAARFGTTIVGPPPSDSTAEAT